MGLDPSVSAFGFSDGTRHETFRTSASLETFARVESIIAQINQLFQDAALDKKEIHVIVEGPSFGSALHGALHDAGYLMARIDLLCNWFSAPKTVVPPATLKKFVTGKGNTPKAEMPLRVYKKWGIEFEDDQGCDKLFAYCLHRYGLAMLTGEIEHAAPKKRGSGIDSKARIRKAARTRASA